MILCVLAALLGAAMFGPYIQNVTDTGGLVIWEGEDLSPVVRAVVAPNGEFALKADTVQVGGDPRVRVRLAIRGVEPGSRVRGHLLDTDSTIVPLSSFSFTTPAPDGPVRFLYFGDSGSCSGTQRTLSRLINRLDADFAAHAGDVIYPSGERKRYDECFLAMYRPMLSRTPFFPVIGNHDIRTSDAAPYLEIFDLPVAEGVPANHRERYYSFRWGPLFWIGLDSNDALEMRDAQCSDGREVSDKNRYETVKNISLELREESHQYRWLVKELAAAPADCWIVINLHAPPLSTTYHESYCGLYKALQAASLEAGRKIDIVISGHEHDYQRSWPIRMDVPGDQNDPASKKGRGESWPMEFDAAEGTFFIVSGGGGGRKMFRPSPDEGVAWIARGEKKNHVMQFFADDRSILFQAIDSREVLLDQVRIVR